MNLVHKLTERSRILLLSSDKIDDVMDRILLRRINRLQPGLRHCGLLGSRRRSLLRSRSYLLRRCSRLSRCRSLFRFQRRGMLLSSERIRPIPSDHHPQAEELLVEGAPNKQVLLKVAQRVPLAHVRGRKWALLVATRILVVPLDVLDLLDGWGNPRRTGASSMRCMSLLRILRLQDRSLVIVPCFRLGRGRTLLALGLE